MEIRSKLIYFKKYFIDIFMPNMHQTATVSLSYRIGDNLRDFTGCVSG